MEKIFNLTQFCCFKVVAIKTKYHGFRWVSIVSERVYLALKVDEKLINTNYVRFTPDSYLIIYPFSNLENYVTQVADLVTSKEHLKIDLIIRFEDFIQLPIDEIIGFYTVKDAFLFYTENNLTSI